MNRGPARASSGVRGLAEVLCLAGGDQDNVAACVAELLGAFEVPGPSFPAAELTEALGVAPAGIRRAAVERGYTRNDRWVVELADGGRVFVKRANDETAAGWLRDEHAIYANVRGDFLARMLGWCDEPGATMLVLEDLSDADWPPPWSAEKIHLVRLALENVATHEPPPGVPPLEEVFADHFGWEWVAQDPSGFLALGLCSTDWLRASLPILIAAARDCELVGESLVHLDVRSDNICFQAGHAILLDWNAACVGNPVVGLANWLPSLASEGGPDPWELLPGAGNAAALVSGMWADLAWRPPAPGARVDVRALERRQLAVALPWAARMLGLPALDGVAAVTSRSLAGQGSRMELGELEPATSWVRSRRSLRGT